MKKIVDKKTTTRLLYLVEKYDTPLYAYNFEKVKKQISTLKQILPTEIDVFYSMKANPNFKLISEIKNNVNGIEVASDGELYCALKAGVCSEQIIFVGPGKTQEELAYAIDSNILSIIVESQRELEIINEISKKQGKVTNVAVRVNPAKESHGARIKMGGVSKQFGIDEECVGEIFSKTKKYTNTCINGIHVYMGTQILDANLLADNFSNILDIAKEIEKEYSVKLSFIDFGGGLGIPYFNGEQPLDLEILRKKLVEIINVNSQHFDFTQIKMILESGRFIIAESGYFLTKILYKKKSRNKTYLITDGGSNVHSSAAGIGRFVRHNFPINILNRSGVNKDIEKVDIVGPLCTPTDVLGQNVELPVSEEGDIVVILNSGAYGLSASLINFLSHSKPAEVLFEEDNDFLIRSRGKREDFLIR